VAEKAKFRMTCIFFLKQFTHWLGYLIFALFVFLVIIVLLNVLNGLAVRDISRIMEEMDTYHNISIIETLASTIFLKLAAQEILIYPNIKPHRQTFFKMPIMGQKVNTFTLSYPYVT
jgi:hypothetical protein